MQILFIFVAALIPLLIGFIWYNPKVFGTAWMKAAYMTDDKIKGANMALIFGLTFLFSLILATGMQFMVIHQFHFGSILKFQPDSQDPNSVSSQLLKQIMELYGDSHRTFKHGAFHGIIGSLFIVMPTITVNALFERKGFKYIAINAGYWAVSMAIMGGVISAFAK